MERIYSIKQALLLFLLAVVWTIMLIMAIYYYRIQLPFSPEILIHGGIIIIILLFIHHTHPTEANAQATINSRFSKAATPFIIISLLLGLVLWLLDYANSVFILHNNIEKQALVLLQRADKEGYISTSLSVCLLAPLAEEMLFRGILLPAFAHSISPRVAIVITSVLFSLIHFSAEAAIILFVGGLFFGILRVSSCNTWPPFLAHCTNNTLTWSAYIIGWDRVVLS